MQRNQGTRSSTPECLLGLRNGFGRLRFGYRRAATIARLEDFSKLYSAPNLSTSQARVMKSQ